MKPSQADITFDTPEPFVLAQQITTDGERITREREQQAADRKESEAKQLAFV